MRARTRRSERGAVAVEFALLLPVLLILIIGMIDVTAGFNAQIQLNQAAQAGARAASLGYAGPVVTQRAAGASPTLGITFADVTAGTCPDPAGPTDTVTVTVNKTYTLPVSFPPLPSLTTLDMSQKAVMPCVG